MDLLQTLSGIAIVFGLLALLYWTAYRLNGVTGLTKDPSKRIKVLERLSLGDKKSLLLVQVGDETLLIGTTPNGISNLASVEPAQEMAEDEESGEAPKLRFSRHVRQMLETLR